MMSYRRYWLAMLIVPYLPWTWVGPWLEFCGLGKFIYQKAPPLSDEGIIFEPDETLGRWIKQGKDK